MSSTDRPSPARRALLAVLALGPLFPPIARAQHVHGAHGGGGSRRPRAPELGISAAFAPDGTLWVAGKETTDAGQHVVVRSSRDRGRSWSAPVRATPSSEPVSADGENRPKLAFGPRGELYVSYTKPLAKPYTGEIRFVRSTDGGGSFSAPLTVHANRDEITHRFDAMIVDRDGRIFVAWIDKRDLEAAKAAGRTYAGAALYYAVSHDGGASFRGDYKIADHSCECCRIALAISPSGRPAALWRHVFDGTTRDHAFALLDASGRPGRVERATRDGWKIDACPHHGPALAYDRHGVRHQAWFNMRGERGGVFHARIGPDAAPDAALATAARIGDDTAAHADLAIAGDTVAIAWKQLDGDATAIMARVSRDGGRTWSERTLARTAGASDQPRLAATATDIVLVWNTRADGLVTVAVAGEAT